MRVFHVGSEASSAGGRRTRAQRLRRALLGPWFRWRIGAQIRKQRPSLRPVPAEPPDGWVLPWWAERQRDRRSAANVRESSRVRYWNGDCQVEADLRANTVGRSWTSVGLPESVERADADPRGLLVLGVWSLDWWVRSGDPWVFASRSASVRQRLADGMPVVETVLRVDGGEVTHRVAAVRGASSGAATGTNAPEVFGLEIENRTKSPLALALAVRPYNLAAFEHVDRELWEWSTGWGIERIEVAGRVLRVDCGELFEGAEVHFDRAPGDVVLASNGTDSASLLTEPLGTAPPAASPVHAAVECPQLLANGAAVFPLVAGSTLRAAVRSRTGAPSGESSTDGRPPVLLDAIPPLERVASGWRQRVDAGCRLDLPAGLLADVALAARAAHQLSTVPFNSGGPTSLGTSLRPALWPAIQIDAQFDGDDLVQLLPLVEMGTPQAVRDLLIRQAQVQDAVGVTDSLGMSVTGTSLVLLEHLLALHPDPEFAAALSEFVAAASRWLLSVDGQRTEQPWALREGLRAAYRCLARLSADRAADALRSEAKSLAHTTPLDVAAAPSSPAFFTDRLGLALRPTDRRWQWTSRDTGLWVHAAVPWAPALPYVGAEPAAGTPADLVPDSETDFGHDMVATALLAFAEARPAPARAFQRLDALASVASPTLNWPTFMHPELRTGTNGIGHDLMVGGLVVRTLLRLLVDVPDGGTRVPAELRLAAHWPAAWLGQPVEVHDVPTRVGKVSWAVRWHGDRPALLWDVTPHDAYATPASAAAPAPTVSAPGLDPNFSSTNWKGEALLAPVPIPAS